MLVNGQPSDGSVQGYHNAAMGKEMAYQTSTLNAELSGRGVRLDMIPRQVGYTFEGLLSSSNQAFGPALDAPQSPLVGRTFRLSTNFEF